MEYIVLDLEWNNGYSKKFKRPVNEIIEIGALRISSDLRICDGFNQLVKTQLTGKLSGRVKALTHIEDSQVEENGVDLKTAVEKLNNWAGEGEKTYITWSNTDIYVLSECNKNLECGIEMTFIQNYMDVQKYCQNIAPCLKSNNQISLINAANLLGVDSDEDKLHRALEDCVLTAKCFIKCFDKEKIKQFTYKCDNEFFERMLFKSYLITDLSSVNIRLDDYKQKCPVCKRVMWRIGQWSILNKSFKAVFLCENCHVKYHSVIRIKQKYDSIEVKPRVTRAKKQKSISEQKARESVEKAK